MADKKINYPTDEWLERWIDHYLDTATERIKSLDELRALAERAWWDNEIEHDRPTPFDLTEEQKAVAKEARKGARAVNAYGKEVKRERKPNEDKRAIIAALYDGLLSFLTDERRQTLQTANMVNVERQIDFVWKGTPYSVTLTAHRPPKAKT